MSTDNTARVTSIRELSSLTPHVISEVSSVLGSIFSVELEVPNLGSGWALKEGKQFCVGLLEPGKHTWRQAIQSLERRERMQVSASLFLARKVLPSSTTANSLSDKHKRLMSSPAAPAPPEYLSFIDSSIDAMFEKGWDRSYRSHVFGHSPNSSSCLEYPLAKGGARRWLAEQGKDWFEDQCLGECPRPSQYKVKYCEVPSGGKIRGVTIGPAYAHVLGPLHRTLYDHISEKPWLLRGEARAKKFMSFRKQEGEVFVSGDYESATDNLSLEVTERILGRILSNCRNVPLSLRSYAMRSLRSEIGYNSGVVNQQRGQLMGNFLSFPLLCLQNYLAFKFAVPRSVPVKINGDDIVFRATTVEFRTWSRFVEKAGLTLSVGKTMVDASFYSLNSCFFEAGRGRPREIPVIRSTMLVPGDGLPGSNEFTRFIRGWKGHARRLLGALWLGAHKKKIQAAGRSVEELVPQVDNSQIHTAGLAVRESFYRGSDGTRLVLEPIPPKPMTVPINIGHDWVRVPHSSVRATGPQRKQWESSYATSCSSMVWKPCVIKPKVVWDEWWDQVRASGRELAWLSWRKVVKRVHRMRGMRSLNMRLCSHRMRPRERTQWVPRDEFQFVKIGERLRGL